MKKPPVYKRSRAKWAKEKEALADVLQAQKVTADQLTPAHDDKQWAWVLNQPDVNAEDVSGDTFKVTKNGNELKAATESAMAHFSTFEGNLKADHTDTHYVFSKVRK